MAENGDLDSPKPSVASTSRGSEGHAADSHSPQTSTKVVSMAKPEEISPMILGETKNIADDFALDRSSPRQYRAKVASKLKGRPSTERFPNLLHLPRPHSSGSPLLTSQHLTASPGILPQGSDRSDVSNNTASEKGHSSAKDLYAQITTWLAKEKARRASLKSKKSKKRTAAKVPSYNPSDVVSKQKQVSPEASMEEAHDDRSRRTSDASEGQTALEDLQDILKRYMTLEEHEPFFRRRGSRGLSYRSSLRKLRRRSTGASSDTDYFEGEYIVPNVDANLDNTKVLAYPAETTPETPGKSPSLSRKTKSREAWSSFKYEILRLAHTLGLKGWRRIALEHSDELDVERLSGALTNAVFVVTPPENMSARQATPSADRDSDSPSQSMTQSRILQHRMPQKVLLRIYGPQVAHLIDRDVELAILRRLCRKNIGPRLLGTFNNGRFEQFLDSKALQPQELRIPETSRQIAKRMKELHEGIDLTQEERDGGPFVWKNWDKWVERCEKVVTWVDEDVKVEQGRRPSLARRGSKVGKELVCGVEWDIFRKAVEKYRTWLEEQYGGWERLKQELVFAHNDTQYGNILRLQPPGDSPLLTPANQHKQLVVIDFEYANANLPGFEFANHFTEWCYDYHDRLAPFACTTQRYPSPEEQYRFVKAYVQHRPSFRAATSSRASTPATAPADARPSILPSQQSMSSLQEFMLDARTPAGVTASAAGPDLEKVDAEEEGKVDAEVRRLLHETKLWRLACSAQWVAWGIVQAKVAGMPGEEATGEEAEANGGIVEPVTDELSPEAGRAAQDLADKRPDEARPEEAEAGDDEFDYLAYAHERALFFWGDAIQVGLVKEEELPELLRKKVKVVEY